VCRADHPSRGVLTEYGESESDRIASTMKRPWPTRDCCAMEKNKNSQYRYLLSLLVKIVCNIFQTTYAKIFDWPCHRQTCVSHSHTALHIHY
jgi:hypothetical protein